MIAPLIQEGFRNLTWNSSVNKCSDFTKGGIIPPVVNRQNSIEAGKWECYQNNDKTILKNKKNCRGIM